MHKVAVKSKSPTPGAAPKKGIRTGKMKSKSHSGRRFGRMAAPGLKAGGRREPPRKTDRLVQEILTTRQAEYAEQWVVIHDGELVAQDRDSEAAIRNARAKYPQGWLGLLFVPKVEKAELISDLFG